MLNRQWLGAVKAISNRLIIRFVKLWEVSIRQGAEMPLRQDFWLMPIGEWVDSEITFKVKGRDMKGLHFAKIRSPWPDIRCHDGQWEQVKQFRKEGKELAKKQMSNEKRRREELSKEPKFVLVKKGKQ